MGTKSGISELSWRKQSRGAHTHKESLGALCKCVTQVGVLAWLRLKVNDWLTSYKTVQLLWDFNPSSNPINCKSVFKAKKTTVAFVLSH